jgi:hypothetical protein
MRVPIATTSAARSGSNVKLAPIARIALTETARSKVA